MSGRCGYVDDIDQKDLAMWRGRVASSIRGKRGQKLLSDLIVALDAMPVKELIEGELVRDKEVCSLGAVAVLRGIDLSEYSPEDHEGLSSVLDVAPCLIQEVEFMNDEWGVQSPESRWKLMRNWAQKNLAK